MKLAKPSTSGNRRVWVLCEHRRYTVRASKPVKPCEKCVSSRANTTHMDNDQRVAGLAKATKESAQPKQVLASAHQLQSDR